MTDPSLADLLRAYERSLIAKVQLSEFQSWGSATTGFFRSTIADHVALEDAYLKALIIRRRQHGS